MVGPMIFMILFIVLGVIMSMGKGSFLIAGFNTMPKKEKEKYDVESLCKYMGKLMFVFAFCMFLFALSDIMMIKVIFYIGLALLLGSCLFTIIFLNTGNRFKR